MRALLMLALLGFCVSTASAQSNNPDVARDRAAILREAQAREVQLRELQARAAEQAAKARMEAEQQRRFAQEQQLQAEKARAVAERELQKAREAMESQKARAREQQITLEVLLVDIRLPVKDGEAAESAITLEGGSKKLESQLLALEKAGHVTRIKRVKLVSFPGLPARVQHGQQVPVASGQMTSGRGTPIRSYRDMSVGLLVQATAQLEKSDVLVEVELEESRLQSVKAEEKEGANTPPAGVETTSVNSTVRLHPQQPHLLSSLITRSEGMVTQQMVIVTATIAPPTASHDHGHDQ